MGPWLNHITVPWALGCWSHLSPKSPLNPDSQPETMVDVGMIHILGPCNGGVNIGRMGSISECLARTPFHVPWARQCLQRLQCRRRQVCRFKPLVWPNRWSAGLASGEWKCTGFHVQLPECLALALSKCQRNGHSKCWSVEILAHWSAFAPVPAKILKHLLNDSL